MQLVTLAIVLMITGILTFFEIRGTTSTVTQAKLTAFESTVQALQQASIQYANINGSYNGLSCGALQADSLWPNNGTACNGNGISTPLTVDVVPQAVNNGANFMISISGAGVVGGGLTPDEYSMLWQHFSSGTTTVPGCNSGPVGSSGVNLCY